MSLDPITAVLDLGGKVLDKIFPDKTKAAEAKLKMIEMAQAGELKELEAQGEILIAEMGGNWLQRSWRPILMLSIVAIVVNNYIVLPYLALFGLPSVELDLPEKLWNLMTLGVGGYIVGRTGEKMVQTIKGTSAA